MHADGTPHSTNARATIENDPDFWVGFEQEYFLYQDGRPLGFPKEGYPLQPQGPYYCGVGYKYMGSLARTIVEEHLELCLAAGINHEGINAEVAKGQWEFQIFAKGSTKAADDLWTARYLMLRLCEQYEVDGPIALQTHQGRLEWFRNAYQLLHQVHSRNRWQGILRSADAGLHRQREGTHCRLWTR